MTSAPFVHLRCHTAYSLLEGAIVVKDLVKLCAKYKMPAVAITDRDNLFGSMEFSLEAAGAGVQPIIGGLFSLQPMHGEDGMGQGGGRRPDQLLLLAKDETGYGNLMKLASLTHLAPEGGVAPLLSYESLFVHAEGVMALTAGIYGAVGRALLIGQEEKARAALLKLKEVFGDRLYMELMRHGMPEEKQIEKGLIALAMEQGVPLVATNDIYFHGGHEMYEAHDALLCIAEGKYVSEGNRRRLTPEHRFKTAEEMRLLFRDLPEALENTLVVAERCAVMSPGRAPILPRFEMRKDGVLLSEDDALREQAKAGLEKRLEGRPEEDKPTYRERLEFELNVIIQMQYSGYFLIVSDFITWSKLQGIPVGPGRGSGAASVVAWSLLITDLDPLKYDLVFERFLNPERVSMPDFDIDFCQERRDEVIRYVQGKYGRDRVAQIITFGKLQARAVLRDVGRVLQMHYNEVDRICKLVPNNPANPVTLEEAINMEPALRQMIRADETVARLVEFAKKLEGLYRHASTHAAGVVIADRPLEELTPLYRDPKSDMPVVQYSMKYAEIAGLVKFDFLGLKTLTVLSKAVKLIGNLGVEIDLAKLPLDDKKTYELLTEGLSVGVFQFESAGMRDSLRKLKPDCLEDLVALGALYRPGPMDNIPTYIARKHGKEKPDYLHPMLTEVLRETYGVIIYQEQVQKIAQVLSGYTLGGADLLRRAMGKKIKSEMDAQRERFVEGAEKNGVDRKQASEIFDLVDKFAGYGFNKAHAAAYALIGYQTAYLKANYAVEFIAASMTLDMHLTDKLAILKEDAARFNIEMLPPDVNKSGAEFTVELLGVSSRTSEHRERDAGSNQEETPHLRSASCGVTDKKRSIRYALGALKNVGEQAMAVLVAERERGGAFKDVFDLAERMDSKIMNRRQLEYMVKAGALDCLNPNRKQLFESLDVLIGYNQSLAREKEDGQHSLFGGDAAVQQVRPALVQTQDWPPLERLEHEFTAVGFYLSAHPLEGYKRVLEKLGVSSYSALFSRTPGEYAPATLAGIVTGVKNKVSDKGRFAFVALSDASGAFEASIFKEDVLNAARPLLEAGNLLLIKCDVKLDDSGPRIIITSIQNLQEIAKGITGKELRIRLRSPEGLPKLKPLLGIPAPKGAVVKFFIPLEDGNLAHVTLAERYHVPPEAVQHIQVLEGVRRVEMV